MKTITPKELKEKLGSNEAPVLVDVREPNERELCNIGGTFIPLGQLTERFGEIPKDAPVVVYCKSGGRSGKAVEFLEGKGYSNVTNLVGGILRWSDEVDPSVTKY